MNNTLKKFTKIPRHLKYRFSLAKNHCAEDIFLVSFAKSGNTWLRFMLANTLKIHYKIQRNVNFFTLHDFIPDIYQAGGFTNLHDGDIFGNPEIPKIIKSHSPYNRFYQRVILIVRDPRDVMISYFYHLKRIKRIPESYTLSQLIHNKEYGIKVWNKHTESWINVTQDGQIINLFRFEDILNNTHKELHRLMDLLGIEVDKSTIAEAIKLSSKENMKNSESNHASTFMLQNQKTSFIRQGKATGGKELSDADKQYIEDVTRDIAQSLGYDY
ncbi:sulfotransferase family protein [Rivularia sp. PCC 7116]|uniref:sulfotransferase domain-containing protein n=1 Tax=Rivularia sp. PCC 7116 TaxID=373994 RepID=UPI00029EF80F|nr:sulfotransferase domain-containing protein [Rivularia sp. PCC 7116]AFY53078.1 sulfotransferase family protein [Rivularia sp. PCC 7116]